MQLAHRPSKILITGNSGSGKSTFASCVVFGSPQRFKFVFDQEGEFGERHQLPTVRYAEQLAEQLQTGWVIYDPAEDEWPDLPSAFEFFSDWVFTLAGELPDQKLFFCDELQALCENWEMPWGLKQILERGRRRGIDTVLVTQQPNAIHNRARNQITEVVAFSQVDENAVKFLEPLGFSGDEIRGLDVGEFRSLQVRTRLFQSGRVDFARGGVDVTADKSKRPINDPGALSAGPPGQKPPKATD